MPEAQRILVTGATGFLGRAIVAAGGDAGHHMVAVSRSGAEVAGAADVQACGDLIRGLDEVEISRIDLTGVDVVIHCAARVHVMEREDPAHAAVVYAAMNSDVPLELAHAAKERGVRRFVQISSVAAIATTTPDGVVLTDDAGRYETSQYGRSKRAADTHLAELACDEFSVTSLRPPAIYGPGVAAHFAKLIRAAKAGWPLPLSAIRNARSFAYVGNVADAALKAATASPRLLQSGSFIVTDSLPISTGSLYSKLLAMAGHSDRVWRWPEPLVRLPARMLLGDRAESLLGSAAFDGSRFAQTFDWQARVDMDEALRLTFEAG